MRVNEKKPKMVKRIGRAAAWMVGRKSECRRGRWRVQEPEEAELQWAQARTAEPEGAYCGNRPKPLS